VLLSEELLCSELLTWLLLLELEELVSMLDVW
jgi:hypothetical protein